ncbi:hypothetical protein FS935_10960 [Metabacillus litoralis]|uniref:Uncharacterized protein n=1 Tax=Metabacillus litoralis TaxID=152268 RepID=A0A5C6VY41_9BACI|nr:hypothetical protein [Metabacillus litoralis]TXC90451.1 hypothetical protein FS935_10960 [Metabacillus litoralis]
MNTIIKTFIKIFIFTSIPFGFFMYIQALIFNNSEPSASLYIIIGLVFGLFMSLILTILDYQSNKSIGEGKSSGVHKKGSIEVQLPGHEAFKVCKKVGSVLNGARISYENQQKGLLIIKTGISWKTWGDIIEVVVEEVGANSTRVSIQSRPLVPTTLVDYGKNSENIQRIIRYLEKEHVSI